MIHSKLIILFIIGSILIDGLFLSASNGYSTQTIIFYFTITTIVIQGFIAVKFIIVEAFQNLSFYFKVQNFTFTKSANYKD
jgi:hypothetical protein